MPFSGEELGEVLGDVRGKIALAFSYQAEDMAVLSLLSDMGLRDLEVFTLDTGKNFSETESYHKEVEGFFHIVIERYGPGDGALEALEKELGEWGIRESLEKRHFCCQVRKVEPLGRALAGKSAWITGLRAAQSVTRTGLQVREYDHVHGMIKINPLFDWSDEDLAGYVRRRGLPLHPLYEQGFRSIGCAPCTRAVSPGEDIRAGRWWWEDPGHKECGLHSRPKVERP
jgi:phosphoadenosine phosphosulfate reductase